MDFLYWLADEIVRFMDGGPGSVALLVYLVLVGAPVVFLHELGHALVALRRLGTDVEVTVGSAAKLAHVRLGQISTSLHAFQVPGRAAGSASFDGSRATARDIFWIALGGPLVSVASGVVAALALSAVAEHGVLHDAAWVAALTSLYGIVNLIPFRLRDNRDDAMPLNSDGRLALDALRVIRELA